MNIRANLGPFTDHRKNVRIRQNILSEKVRNCKSGSQGHQFVRKLIDRILFVGVFKCPTHRPGQAITGNRTSDKLFELIFRTEFSSPGHDQVHVHVGVVVAVVVDGVVVLQSKRCCCLTRQLLLPVLVGPCVHLGMTYTDPLRVLISLCLVSTRLRQG